MEKRIALLVASLVLMQVLGPGCAIRGDSSIVSYSKDELPTGVADAGMAFVQDTSGSLDVGVINDTVVDVFREPDTKSERVTQALYNQPARILGSSESWTKVKVVDGYTGWIKSKYLENDLSSINYCNFKFRVIITSKIKKIYAKAGSDIALITAVMGSEFYSKNKKDGWYEIALPGNKTGWIDESGCIQLAPGTHIPKTSPEDFVLTAGKFKGTVYLWGGVSSRGMDCSGLTYICGRINGVDLPRDADKQFSIGENVKDLSVARPGDLIFLGNGGNPEVISHVMIYIGNNQVLHASKSKGSVIISPLDDTLKNRIVGIRRIF